MTRSTHLSLATVTLLLLVTGCKKESDQTPPVTPTAKRPAPGPANPPGQIGGETPTPVEDPAPATPNETPPPSPSPVTQAPAAPALPSYWFESDFDKWIGQRWNDVDLFQFLGTKPAGIDQGKRYVVFYSRTCDHCEDMFNDDFAPNPSLAAMVTAIEVPDSKTRLRSPGGWDMPPVNCERLELPLGVNWIITTPLTVRVEDGVIRCAEEGEHRNCMELQ